MSVLTMMSPLLRGVELTPDQLAELRALDTLYYTRLATDPGEPTDGSATSRTPNESRSELAELVLSRVRDLLHDEQRVIFDLNHAALATSVAAR